jgi:hypothetical protein
MERIGPRREIFAVAVVSADMGVLCDGNVSLGKNDLTLNNSLREKAPRLASYREDEKARRSFWSLGLGARA